MGRERERLGRQLLREASGELARLRRIRGASRRTARRVARERARLAFAAALLGAPLGEPALARPPSFVNPLAPFGLGNVGGLADPEFADVDGDGDLDAFVGEHDGNTLFFGNTGTTSAPAFVPPATSPFGLARASYYASPAFADLDGDGDLDALVGDFEGDTFFFENTGTASAPAFAPSVTNPFGLAEVGFRASPTLADLDGDADLDTLIGNSSGNTIFFEHTGTPNAPAFAAPAANAFGLAEVERDASPTLADLDGDGDLDALVGEESGNTVFFRNTGTAMAPAFAAPETNPFGLAGVESYATPDLADLDGDGDLDVLVGEQSGNMLFFANTGTASAPAFASAATNPFGLADVGRYASPTLADLDGDGDLDALVGFPSGWVIFFENLAALCPDAPEPSCTTGFGKASLQVDEHKPGKEKLAARLSKGPELAQADFGDPTAPEGTEVALCVYDDSGARVATLGVDRAGESCGSKPCWRAIGGTPPDGKGFAYKDAEGSAAGVRSLELKGGAAGKSSLAVSASNKKKKRQTALPTGITAALEATTSVTVQLHSSEGACFGATLTDILTSTSERFRAK